MGFAGYGFKGGQILFGADEFRRISLAGMGKHRCDVPRFCNAAVLQHIHAVREKTCSSHVVRNKEHRERKRFLQPLEQLQDFSLHAGIQGTRRFIGDQKLRTIGERHGNHDALLLAARKFIRVFAGRLFGLGQIDHFEEFEHARMRILV
ncbi:putative uncharacterized protein [Sutterella wadsworthensis CAG:135]|nr:putative uncharacterized protein [Sutterella wadsworthensis CAG:135]